MNNILVYTFFNYTKKCSKALYNLDLEDIDKLFVPNTFSTKKLLEIISNYEYVIGIADQNKNASRSRFDPKYVNRYGRRMILEGGREEYISNLRIDLPEGFYEYKSITNGPCNRSAYLIMNKIANEKLNTKFGFFHLRKQNIAMDLPKVITSFQ